MTTATPSHATQDARAVAAVDDDLVIVAPEALFPPAESGSRGTVRNAQTSDPADLVGLTWSGAFIESVGLDSSRFIDSGSAGTVQLAPGLGTIVTEVGRLGDGSAQQSFLVFGVDVEKSDAAVRWTSIAALDIELEADQQTSLPHAGCSVDGVYDAGVIAVLQAPEPGSRDSAREDWWPAVRAWRFSADGLIELKPDSIECELAGE
jgi:hypothetical protein